MPLGCKLEMCLLCVQMSEKVKEYVIQPSVSIQAVPLPAVTDFVYRKQKNCFIGTRGGWHVHK